MKRIVGWVGLLMVLGCLAPGVHATSSAKVTVQLIITNAQGSVVAKMTPDGVPTYSADYRPYGTTQSTPQAGPGYTGHVMDPTSGLVYMQQRYYDPATGRFISPDPVAPTPGNVFNFGRYTYANDNPIRFTDPDGRCAAYGSAQGLCKQAAQRAKKDQQIIDSGGSVELFSSHELLGQTITVTYYDNVDATAGAETNTKLTAAMDLLNASESKLGPSAIYLIRLIHFIDITSNPKTHLGVIGPHRVLFSTDLINSSNSTIPWVASLFVHEGTHIRNMELPESLRLPRWMGERSALMSQSLIGEKIGLTPGQMQYLGNLENNIKYLKSHVRKGYSY